MTDRHVSLMRLNFDSLPLVEATVRAGFESPIWLKFSVVNKVYERLREEFPVLSEPTQFEFPPGTTATLEIGPNQITGAVYEGNPQGLIVSIFPQLITSRWRRAPGSDAPAYPRYAALKENLWKATDALCEASTAPSKPAVAVVNMSYINLLQIPHAAPVLLRYFSKQARAQIAESAKVVHKTELSWKEPDSFDLRYCIEAVHVTIGDQRVEGYQLTTASGVRPSGEMSMPAALDDVHSRLQKFFLDLISDDAKLEWGLKRD